MKLLRHLAAAFLVVAVIVTAASLISASGASRLVGNAAAQGPVSITVQGSSTRREALAAH